MTATGGIQPEKIQATETFAAEVDGRLFFVRTGDKMSPSHPVARAHPTRFDHHHEPQASAGPGE